MSKKKKGLMKAVIAIVVIIIVAVFGFEYFGHGNSSENSQNIYIGVQYPKVANISNKIEEIGTVKSYKPVTYFADKTIKISKAVVRVGDVVKKGDLLFITDIINNNNSSYYSTNLSAPINGVIVEAATLGAEFNLNSKTPVYKITDISKVIVMSDILESKVNHVKIGEKVEFTADFLNKTMIGKVNWISSVAKPKKNSKNEIPYISINILLDNLKHLLKPGFYGNISIITAEAKNVLTLPITAVMDLQSKPYIYYIDSNNVVSKKFVEIGIISTYTIEVKDIDKTLEILTNPPQSIKVGEKLSPKYIKYLK